MTDWLFTVAVSLPIAAAVGLGAGWVFSMVRDAIDRRIDRAFDWGRK